MNATPCQESNLAKPLYKLACQLRGTKAKINVQSIVSRQAVENHHSRALTFPKQLNTGPDANPGEDSITGIRYLLAPT